MNTKIKKILTTTFLFTIIGTSILFSGCTDKNNNNLRALNLLKKANNNFIKQTNYLEIYSKTNVIDQSDTETRIEFNQYIKEPNKNITVNKDKNFTLAYPKIVSNEEAKKEIPTLIIDNTEENNKMMKTEYIYLKDIKDYIELKKKENKTKISPINQNAILELMEKAEKGVFAKDKDTEILLETYTKGFFYMRVLPSKIKNLKFEQEKTINDKKYIVLTGDVEGLKDEMFSIYEKAKVEFWIDKKTNNIYKEIYRNINNQKEITSFTYLFNFNNGKSIYEETKNKDLNKKIEFYKNILE